ncbi:uncharacterized protein LOC117654262 isoform X2 [Thrips palmi]|uniref:Uncharacterized protein LOC117654262 isoform X2 n=1 Tax=Thrips palmi TaxID=161013 RepID=A0A6P9AGW2_THRPL|nr:uncharacterized protein LOC117654262 isoform X2 [Thrips palmi]
MMPGNCEHCLEGFEAEELRPSVLPSGHTSCPSCLRTGEDRSRCPLQDAELLRLPDAVLVQVLRFVDVFDVVRCRQACRRLKALSTHPQVWQHRALDDSSRSAARALRVALELAPCARSLSVAARASLRALARLAAKTSCAAEELCLSPDDYVEEAVLVLQRQADLGGLKSLTLECRLNPDVTGYEREMGDLLSIVFTIDGLEELSVAFMFWRGMTMPLRAGTKLLQVPSPCPKPSLKSLIYSVSQEDAFLQGLLRLHGPTLEKVALGGMIDLSLPAMEALVSMASLQKLCVPLTEGVDLLRACPALTKLTLVVHRPSPQALADGEELLRSATTLTTLKIKTYRYTRREPGPKGTKPPSRSPPPSAYSAKCVIRGCSSDMEELMALCYIENEGRNDGLVVPALVKALASSGCSRVERLALCVNKDQLPAGLVGVLPGLGALKDLRLQDVSDGFLRGIRHAVAPRLTRLHVWWLAVAECKHGGLLHDKAEMRRLKDLLRRHPGLHVTVNYSACAFHGAQGKCRHCKAGCHAAFKDAVHLGFFTHDARQDCDVCNDDSVVWHERLRL